MSKTAEVRPYSDKLAVKIRNILSTAASLVTCLHSVASRAKDLDVKPRVVRIKIMCNDYDQIGASSMTRI